MSIKSTASKLQYIVDGGANRLPLLNYIIVSVSLNNYLVARQTHTLFDLIMPQPRQLIYRYTNMCLSRFIVFISCLTTHRLYKYCMLQIVQE